MSKAVNQEALYRFVKDLIHDDFCCLKGSYLEKQGGRWIAYTEEGLPLGIRFITLEKILDYLEPVKTDADTLNKRIEEEPMRMLESLTPGGSEYVDDPKRCVEFVKDNQRSLHELIVKLTKENKELKKQALANLPLSVDWKENDLVGQQKFPDESSVASHSCASGNSIEQ